jgi:hypothetical protein
MRAKALRRYERNKLISEARPLRGLVYVYKNHRAKTELIIDCRLADAASIFMA